MKNVTPVLSIDKRITVPRNPFIDKVPLAELNLGRISVHIREVTGRTARADVHLEGKMVLTDILVTEKREERSIIDMNDPLGQNVLKFTVSIEAGRIRLAVY